MSESSQSALPNPVEATFPVFSESFLKIRTKESEVIPFRLNVVQLELDEIIEKRRREGRPVRIIVLKARQEGISTYSLGRMYQYCTTREAVEGLMAAHDDDSSTALFDRLRLMYDMAPAKPMTRYSSQRILDFANPKRKQARTEPGLLSKCRVGTAGKLNLGRSFTLNYLHISELAFWNKADIVMLGLEQVLPKHKDTIEIIESTANGVGGEFYDRWKRAEDPKTAGEWVAVFFPWWKFPEYEEPLIDKKMFRVPSCVEDIEAFIAEEEELRRLYSLTDEQLNWRRWAIVNQCGNNLKRFRQEYPANPDEAFITSGNPIFNLERISSRVRVLRAADQRLDAEGRAPRFQVGNVHRKGNRFSWVPSPDGMARVYRWPEGGHEYCIGADTAEGKSKGKDPDFSAFQVFDVHTWEQCMVFHGRLPVSDFFWALYLTGYFYNEATIVPEVNNHGHTLTVKLEEEGYSRLYLRQDFDRLGNKIWEKSGWETNAKTRPILVDAVDDSINSATAKYNDLPTLAEFMTFVRNLTSGKPEAAEGCHDDLVIASGICLAVMTLGDQPMSESTPITRGLTEEQRMVMRDLEKVKRQYRLVRRLEND